MNNLLTFLIIGLLILSIIMMAASLYQGWKIGRDPELEADTKTITFISRSGDVLFSIRIDGTRWL